VVVERVVGLFIHEHVLVGVEAQKADQDSEMNVASWLLIGAAFGEPLPRKGRLLAVCRHVGGAPAPGPVRCQEGPAVAQPQSSTMHAPDALALDARTARSVLRRPLAHV
jgi:hypothetical protein